MQTFSQFIFESLDLSKDEIVRKLEKDVRSINYDPKKPNVTIYRAPLIKKLQRWGVDKSEFNDYLDAAAKNIGADSFRSYMADLYAKKTRIMR